jgi:hypothetical protein
MSRRAEKIVCRASRRDSIYANFSRVSFSTASFGFNTRGYFTLAEN